ncbi:MAG: vWA domain-containing protein [Pseudomonadota bacterium]
MLEPTHCPKHRGYRLLRWSLLVGAGLGAVLLAGCGARSAVDLLEASAAGGAPPQISRQDPAMPAGGAGAPAFAGAPAVAGSPAQGGAAMMPPAPACEAVSVAIDELRPALTLVVDQSLSMRFRYPDEQSPATRWSLVGDALFDPTNGVVKEFETSVRFGIAFFTSWGGMCPILNEVQAQTRNYDALNMLYRSLSPQGDTPTGDALQQVVGELEKIPSHGPRSILLVTDGNPDTCAQPNPDEGQPQAVAAAQRAFESGIELYVLGISNGIAGQNLQQLANAGLGRPIDLVWGVDADAAQPFQASENVQGLTAQLSDLLNRIPLCEVRLQRDVALDEVSRSQVLLDGQPLGYSALDGYVLKDSRHLAIVGKACAAIKAGGQQLSVRISCD